jgi:hypothetical protein
MRPRSARLSMIFLMTSRISSLSPRSYTVTSNDNEPGKIIYPGVGVLEVLGEFPDPQAITSATMPDAGTVKVNYADGTTESFTLADNKVDSYNAGIVKFSTVEGENYQIRPIQSEDGSWLSQYKTSLPTPALKTLAQTQTKGK